MSYFWDRHLAAEELKVRGRHSSSFLLTAMRKVPATITTRITISHHHQLSGGGGGGGPFCATTVIANAIFPETEEHDGELHDAVALTL